MISEVGPAFSLTEYQATFDFHHPDADPRDLDSFVKMLTPAGQLRLVAAAHGFEAVVDIMPFALVNEAIERIRKTDVEIGLVLET